MFVKNRQLIGQLSCPWNKWDIEPCVALLICAFLFGETEM